MNNLLPKIPDLIDPTSADFQFSSDDKIYRTRPSGGIIQVVDIKTAAAAFDTIIEQGEGAGGSSHDEDPSELAHFFQFAKLLQAPPPAVIKTIDNPKTPDYKDPKIAAVRLAPYGPQMTLTLIRWPGYRMLRTACSY